MSLIILVWYIIWFAMILIINSGVNRNIDIGMDFSDFVDNTNKIVVHTIDIKIEVG